MNNILLNGSNLDCQVELDIEQSTWCLWSIIPKGYC